MRELFLPEGGRKKKYRLSTAGRVFVWSWAKPPLERLYASKCPYAVIMNVICFQHPHKNTLFDALSPPS